MNLITGNLNLDEGQILLNDTDVREMKNKYIAHIGYMPQQQAVYENLSLMRFMYYMASLKGICKKNADEQIRQLLLDVDLWDVRNRKLGSFSGGMKQRALIAQAMLGDSDIIILDEPTAGLDPLQRVAIRELIQTQAEDKIVIISTHVISDIEPIAKEILMLRKGKLLKNCFLEEKREGETLEQMYVRLFQ
jgi:ABC-type multidrug transport system ATPase subunit